MTFTAETQRTQRVRRESFCVALTLLVAVFARAEIIDRVAVKVDTSVITESQVLEEIRITAFLNGEQPDLRPENKRRAAERMIEQVLIRREMEVTHYPQPQPSEIEEALAQVRARSGGEEAFRAALRRYGITEEALRQALLRQASLLRFIELRFKPEVQVLEPEIMQYYENVCVPEARSKGLPRPSREACEETLVAGRVDQRVDAWLKETRGRLRVQYEEDAFQ